MTIARELSEAIAAKIGAIHKRSDGNYQKMRDGTWKRIPEAHKKSSQAPQGEWKPAKNADEAMSAKDAPLPTGRKWIDHAPGLPTSTQDKYKDPGTGQYTPERQALHEQIIDSFLSKGKPVPEDKQPVTLFMLGTTASGKTSARKSLKENPFGDHTPVEVDPDAIKQLIPEYKQAVAMSAKDAAFMAHEESSDIAQEIQRRAVAKRMNVIIDGTGANLPSMQKKITASKGAGYTVHALMPHVNAEECTKRADARAEKTGRYVPHHIIEDCAAKVGRNFMELSRNFDKYTLFDNHGEKPVITLKGPPPQIKNKSLFGRFKRENGIPEWTKQEGYRIVEQEDMDEFDRWYIAIVSLENEIEKSMPKKFNVGEGIQEVLGD